jgi:hypothetical protein
VLYIAEAAAGLSDAEVLALALREQRILLTEDKERHRFRADVLISFRPPHFL